jgi:hypothetical protein
MIGSYMCSLRKPCCMSFVNAYDQTRHAHQIRELSNVVGRSGFKLMYLIKLSGNNINVCLSGEIK